MNVTIMSTPDTHQQIVLLIQNAKTLLDLTHVPVIRVIRKIVMVIVTRYHVLLDMPVICHRVVQHSLLVQSACPMAVGLVKKDMNWV